MLLTTSHNCIQLLVVEESESGLTTVVLNTTSEWMKKGTGGRLAFAMHFIARCQCYIFGQTQDHKTFLESIWNCHSSVQCRSHLSMWQQVEEPAASAILDWHRFYKASLSGKGLDGPYYCPFGPWFLGGVTQKETLHLSDLGLVGVLWRWCDDASSAFASHTTFITRETSLQTPEKPPEKPVRPQEKLVNGQAQKVSPGIVTFDALPKPPSVGPPLHLLWCCQCERAVPVGRTGLGSGSKMRAVFQVTFLTTVPGSCGVSSMEPR